MCLFIWCVTALSQVSVHLCVHCMNWTAALDITCVLIVIPSLMGSLIWQLFWWWKSIWPVKIIQFSNSEKGFGGPGLGWSICTILICWPVYQDQMDKFWVHISGSAIWYLYTFAVLLPSGCVYLPWSAWTVTAELVLGWDFRHLLPSVLWHCWLGDR